MRRLFRALLLSLFAMAAPAAQQVAASRFALAIVNDSKGKPVVDISVDDFVVQEGGVNREVLDVRVADYPIVIVIDNGAAAMADFTAMKGGVLRFVERTGPRPLAIVTAGGVPAIVASFEDERETVVERIKAIEPAAALNGQPLRAAALAGEAIKATGTLFSAIVLATATPAETDSLQPFASPIIDSRAVVHVVAANQGVAATEPLLRGLAQQTRGDFTTIFAGPSFLPALENLAGRLSTELMIEYIVPVGSHSVDPKVGVRIPGARVRGLGVAPR